ncbi:hypothetical protein EV670_3278 [Rivibacter subsaxonicus]|uniref:Uncharacterized protein n=2 Tax=Rivibacter subsaxonicus TaxID=457575 RepID=A0A4Q7VAT9_9BURK|nr:hypothetical protein EV670_3278 [Rivibacter subsaxonicus]
MDSFEWIGRCARRILELDCRLAHDDAEEMAHAFWAAHGDKDPIEVANGDDPEAAADRGEPLSELTEAQWVDRYVARVGQITLPAQVIPEAAVAQARRLWLGLCQFEPETMADINYGNWPKTSAPF